MDCSTCESRRNWEDVPIELLGLILKRLVLLPDFIRFGAVCKSWNLAKEEYSSSGMMRIQEPPMLLIPGRKDYRVLYSVCEEKIYPHGLKIPSGGRICGSSYGWLAIVVEKKDNLAVDLFNPFSGTTIHLPTLTNIQFDKDWPGEYINKIILSCDPCLYPNDWIAVAIVEDSHCLDFIRSGEESWTLGEYYNDLINLVDACFYQGKLCYVLNWGYALVAIDFTQHVKGGIAPWLVVHPKIVNKTINYLDSVDDYLVELEKDLLLVHRIYRHLISKTIVQFQVRKLSDSGGNNGLEWIDIHDLGKYSLFLGTKESVAIYYDSCSNAGKFKPNCIYYTDDFKTIGGRSMSYDHLGVYNLATGEISRHIHEPSENFAVWISPKLEKQIAH